MKRGYYGIGIYMPKTTENMGTLWRSAHNFGADFIFTIGARYKKQPGDTTFASRHIPLYNYQTYEDFSKTLPFNSDLVFIEQTNGSTNLKEFEHPERAIYILGAEDKGVPIEMMKGFQKIFIDTPMCLNVAVAGSIVMFDRKNSV